MFYFVYFAILQLLLKCIAIQSKSAVLQKSVSTYGFHRALSYSVVIHNVFGAMCLMIEENFPPAIYVDPYQLACQQRNWQIQIDSPAIINTEEPAYLAKSIKVKVLSKSHDNIHHFDIPIHLRYQKPQSCLLFGEQVAINLGLSNFYLTKAHPDVSSTDLCSLKGNLSWTQLEAVTHKIKLESPVGCIEHFYIVFGLTVCFILVGSVMFWNQILNKVI